MAKITRIKAGESKASSDSDEESILVREKVEVKDKNTEKKKRTEKKRREKEMLGESWAKTNKSGKKPFILFRPFVALWYYIRDSWRELRQVRWPNRKATWKMVFAVLVYAGFFMGLIMILDSFFTWLSGLVLGN